MEKEAYKYAIVRFMPFLETGEFANVGIVMMSPRARYFGFKLMTRRYGRVTRFFEELDSKVLRSSMTELHEELDRVHGMLKSHGFDKRLKTNDEQFAHAVFAEVLRARESIVRFSEPRVVLSGDPKAELQKLYSRYIERNFVTKEYRERTLESRLRKMFVRANIVDRYAPAKIGDDSYHVTFPFVEKLSGKPRCIIKPLNLAEGEPSRIIERGGQWGFRVHELRKRNLLPDKVLFTVDSKPNNRKVADAYAESVEVLRDTGVEVVEQRNEDRVLEFAAGN